MSVIVMEDLDKLDESIRKLRISYEKYFAGVERLEPLRERDRVRSMLRRMIAERTANTARKFRLQQAQATMITHEQYWNRITRQIEEGTYKRDKLRAQRMLKERSASEESRERHAEPPPKAQQPSIPAAVANLHRAYTDARKQLGHPSVSVEALARTVAKQTEAIKQRYKCNVVEFKVAVKDGRAILKAVPK